MANVLRRLTYFPQLTNLARRAGVAPALRSLYYRWATPRGVLKLQVSDVCLSLYARNPEEVRDLKGASMSNDCAWSERHTLETCLAFLAPGDIVYDVGANYGLYSVALGKRVGEQGQIIAFEPLRRNFERLQANIQLNDLKNIRCFPYALGEQADRTEMYVEEERPWRSTLLKGPPSSRQAHAAEVVEVVEGDWFRRTQSLPVPRAVKINVEGFEYSVMRGLRQMLAEARCEFLVCEVHPQLLPAGTAVEDILGLLRSCGFNGIDSHARGPELHIFCYKR